MQLPRSSLGAAAALALAVGVHGQTLVGWDGVGTVDEWTGPPDPAVCGYPSGPIVASFPLGAVGCPGVLPIGPPGLFPAPGGVAYDSVADLVYVSDGALVEVYAAGGGFLDSFLMPLPVFGLGFDSAGGLLWATDGGLLAYAVAPPAVPACGAPVAPAVLPFPVPTAAAPLTGIDWDPLSASLWAADAAGLVHNCTAAGAPGPIAFAPFPVAPGPCWGVPPPTLRVAVDDGSPFGPGHLYVSDGFLVFSQLPGGAPAPPTFAFPGPGGAPCFPNPVPQLGIAYAAHGIPYGAGVDPDGLPAPVGFTTGASISPGPGFAHGIAAGVPGGLGVLVLGGAFACPSFPVLGVPSYLSPLAPFFVLGTAPVGAGGGAALPTPLPAGLAPGSTLFTQWFVVKPAGPSLLQVTNGLSFRTAIP